ncbi:polyadenylate-binding protein, putative, partial [Ichthyophthirius multifiliis]
MQKQEQSEQKPTNIFQVFIKDIDLEVEEKDIISSLEKYGKIIAIKLTQSLQHNHKYCFLGFESQDSAQQLLSDSQNVIIYSQKVTVKPYQQDLVNLNSNAYVFINGLPSDVTDKDLIEALNQYKFGEILHTKVKTSHHPGSQGKHYATVVFRNESEAQSAIQYGVLSTKFGKIQCERYNPTSKNEKCQIVIKNIQSSVNKEQLEQQMQQDFGTITSFTIKTQRTFENKQMAFVTFQKPEEAEAALTGMNQKNYYQNDPLDVQWYKKEESEDSNVYIKNIKNTVSENTLKQALQKYGEVISFFLNSPKDNLIQTRYAIVAFKTAEQAKELMKNSKKDKQFASLFKDDYPYVTPHLTKQEKSEYSTTKRVNQNPAPLNQQNQQML